MLKIPARRTFRDVFRLTFLSCCTLLLGVVQQAPAADPAFPEVFNTQKTPDGVTSPAEAVASIRLPDGFQATLFAAEPDVRQPIGFTTDERGRLWVAENYTYAEQPIRFDNRLRDRIVILEDSDGDGTSDRRTVFWDQAERLTSVEVGFDGVWALCPPHLLFLPDRNHDDVLDGPPEIVLTGFAAHEARHNIANGLKWGPDGWLYGRHGILSTSLVGLPDSPDSARVPITCGIWRYHPTRKSLQVVATGTTNPWGFDYDENGEMFFSNTVIGHLWHVVPGAHFRRMYGADSNPHTYELIEQTADHFHWDTGQAWHESRNKVTDTTLQAGGGHAHCGLMCYLGDNWPERYRGTLFTVNLHGLRVNNDVIERQGCGFVVKHGSDFLFTDDPWFRGIELIYGPDGGVYLADWSDIGECHESDGVHRETGRIYKITFGKPQQPVAKDLSQLSDLQLIELQSHRNEWFVRNARRLLQERAVADPAAYAPDSPAVRALLAMFEASTTETHRLRALWCLASMDAVDDTWLLSQLDDSNEHVRLWVIRLLANGEELPAAYAPLLAQRATGESSGLVRSYLASSLQRLPVADRWDLANALGSHSEDADDAVQPLMLWYGIEPAVLTDPSQAVLLAKTTSIPKLRTFIARRLTEQIETAPAPVNALLASISQRKQEADYIRDILTGLQQALVGWRKAPQPENWQTVATLLDGSENEELQQLAENLGVMFGDGQTLDRLFAIAGDDKADPQMRTAAVTALLRSQHSDVLPSLKKWVSDRVLAPAVIRGFAKFEDKDIPRLTINMYGRLTPEGQSACIDTLCSRPQYALALVDAIERGTIARTAVSAYHARQIQSLGSDQVNARLAKVWGEVRESSADKLAEMKRLKAELTADRIAHANASAGRAIFQKTCAACHALYGQGGRVGPDLTGSNRKNLDYLLENLVDPSALVAADYRMSIVLLMDGRVMTGVIADQSEPTLTIQAQKERFVVDRRDVDSVTPTAMSLMPEGMTKTFTLDQIIDLTAYLMSPRQVPLTDAVSEAN